MIWEIPSLKKKDKEEDWLQPHEITDNKTNLEKLKNVYKYEFIQQLSGEAGITTQFYSPIH